MFGVPADALLILPGVAALVSASTTAAGVAVGWPARYSAAAPTTCGVAVDVPLIVLVAVSGQAYDDVMPTPGG